ncbi:MAG: response regulator transcription factor [Arcobacteraceae bacterium]|nr:response regulator transcription factor [Arcobacteraceae bacterium]
MDNNFLKELKVLLVEDEENLSQLLKNAIGDNFDSFTVANNGKDGIEKFKKISPDLVITDIMMPVLTGLEMAKELKQINPNISIIILSAFSDKDKLLNAIDVGVVKYFIKPFDPDELLNYIISISSTLGSNLILLAEQFKFNKVTGSLYKNNKLVPLSRKEKDFLQLMAQKSPEVINDVCIKSVLWKDEEVSDERLRTFIKRLRIKTSKRLVQNVKGQGYQIALA